MLLISPKTDATQASCAVTTLIHFTITTQEQPVKNAATVL